MKSCDRILKYIQDVVKHLEPDMATDKTPSTIAYQLSASGVAEALAIKRNFASHHLNRLVEEGYLRKTQTRPVTFLPTSDDALRPKLNMTCDTVKQPPAVSGRDPFEGLIGTRGSLAEIIEQCRSAVLYPPKGLPILLCGPSGSGKSLLARKLYEFSVFAEVLEAKAPFIVFNCAEYAHNPELLSSAIFGHTKGAFTGADAERTGMLEAANGGILFLDEMHRLSPESQEKLFLFLDQGTFRRLGETQGWRKAQVRMVFATTVAPDAVNHYGESVMLTTFLRRIPLVVKVPSYHERPLAERMRLIHQLFHKEATGIERDLILSGQVLSALINAELEGNIGNLENMVKLSCARALSSDRSKVGLEPTTRAMSVRIAHLPKSYLGNLVHQPPDMQPFEDLFISRVASDSEVTFEKDDHAFVMIESLLAGISNRNDLLNAQKNFNHWVDSIVFEPNATANEPILSAIQKMVDFVLTDLQKQYGIQFLGNSVYVVSQIIRYMYEITIKSHVGRASGKIIILERLLSKEMPLAKQLVTYTARHLDVAMPPILEQIIALYIKSLQKENEGLKTRALILAHGYATASSIASVANRILNHYVYDAIDMPLDITRHQVGQYLKKYVATLDHPNGLVLLVDMGSLEHIYQEIETELHCDIAVVNNITTQLALDVGSRILNLDPIEDIVKQVVTIHQYRYHYIARSMPMQAAILVTCSTGIGTAQKISSLLSGCLASEPVEVLPYDFDSIRGKGLKDSIFKRYDIKLLIGTQDPGVTGLPYISLEDLMLERDVDWIANALHDVVSLENIEKMHREIIKVFTLENILNALTILNPHKVAAQVEEALLLLETYLKQTLKHGHRMSLTVHLCCMIERLVMKTPLPIKAHIQNFETHHADFVNFVRKAFKGVEGYYQIEIPIAEIAFIWEHLINRPYCQTVTDTNWHDTCS